MLFFRFLRNSSHYLCDSMDSVQQIGLDHILCHTIISFSLHYVNSTASFLIQYIYILGYPLTRKELLFETKRIMDIDGRKTPFKDNLPGKGWFKAFFKRNPDLVERTPAALGHQRAAISFAMIQGYLFTLRNNIQYVYYIFVGALFSA